MMVGSEVIFSFWWVGSVFVSNYICLWYQLRITVGKPIYRKTPSSFKSHIGFPVCLSQSYRYTEISNTVYRDFSIYWNFRHTEIIEVTTFFNERHSILLESVNLSLYYTIRVTACLSKSFDKDIYIDILSYCNDHHRALYYKTETSHSQKFKLASLGFFYGSVALQPFKTRYTDNISIIWTVYRYRRFLKPTVPISTFSIFFYSFPQWNNYKRILSFKYRAQFFFGHK